MTTLYHRPGFFQGSEKLLRTVTKCKLNTFVCRVIYEKKMGQNFSLLLTTIQFLSILFLNIVEHAHLYKTGVWDIKDNSWASTVFP